MATKEATDQEALNDKENWAHQAHSSCICLYFHISGHYSPSPSSQCPCILRISVLFNNEKYLFFPGVGDISPFSEAFILSACTNSTQGLVVFSYEILMRVTVPSNHHLFQGAKVLLTVLTPCHPSSFPETSAHIDFFFFSQIKGCFLGKPNLDSHPGSARFQWFSFLEVPFTSSLKHFGSW